MQLYQLFLPVEHVEAPIRKRNLKRRFILSYFLNGDLRRQEEVQHFCLFNCCASFEQTLKRIRRVVAWALVPTKPPLFARSRWNKWDHAIDYVGILAGIHGLLSELTMEFLGPEKSKLAKGMQHADAHVTHVEAEIDALDDLYQAECNPAESFESRHQQQQQRDQSDPQQAEAAPEAQEQQQEKKSSMENQFDWNEFNRQQKVLTRKWVNTNPFNRLTLMKECAEPLMRLMYKYLLYSGSSWEKKQQLESAKGHSRSYVVLEKAHGHDDQQCMNHLYKLFTSRPHVLLEDAPKQEVLALLRFRAVSSGLCSVHSLLRLPHQSFPFKLFKVLLSDHHATEILDEPECKRDALASFFLRQYAP